MPQRHNLRSRFEAEGVFWTPSDAQSKFSAHISARGKLIELTTAAEIGGLDRLFPVRDAVMPNLLHGYTTVGTCTLIGVQEKGGFRHSTGASGVVIVRRFRVGVCVLGLHLAAFSTAELASATYSYAGLGDWLRPPTKIDLTEDAVLINHPRQTPPLVDFCVPANKTRIQVRVVSPMTWTPSGRHSASGDEPLLSIEPMAPTSLEGLMNTARRFENFFSLCVGTSVLLRTIQLTSSAGNEGWLVYPHVGKVDKPDIEASIRCDHSELAGSMAAWLTTFERLRPLENLIFGSIRKSAMFVETEFLSLAQALESFHRLTDSAPLTDSLAFKRTLKILLKTIGSACANDALARRLADGVRYANEPAFKNRIEALLSRLPPHHVLDLLGDPIVFEQTLRQTRNFFTHQGTAKQKHVLEKVKEIFLFNQKLHALLRLLMLMNLGFSEDAVFEIVRYQSRKWS